MNWLVIFSFVVPASTGAPLTLEFTREGVVASTPAACEAWAGQRAAQLREQRRSTHPVVGRCQALPAPQPAASATSAGATP